MSDKNNFDEICARPPKTETSSSPSTSPIYPSVVYECESTQHARELLKGDADGFAYLRDGHPNAVSLAEQCRRLHGGAELGVAFAHVTSTGMSALALAILSALKSGDHVLLSDQLYGRTTRLVSEELGRWGLQYDEVDMCDLEKVKTAIQPTTRMLIVETIANPLLHVADLNNLSSIAHSHEALLLVDNTFATPLIVRPFEFGADLVMESLTKIINGHGDVMLGLLCGKEELRDRSGAAISSWGMTLAPFDCWLASRGLATAHLRIERASNNALQLATFLSEHRRIKNVFYPGLNSHVTHEMAKHILGESMFGSMLSVEFEGGVQDVDLFIKLSQKISFCPSLGEIATTISHPRSTSHLGLTNENANRLGISEGLMRISCGIESAEFLIQEFKTVLEAMD